MANSITTLLLQHEKTNELRFSYRHISDDDMAVVISSTIPTSHF